MYSREKAWLLRGGLVLASLVMALACAEIATRLVYPISDGRENVTLDGRPIKSFFAPGSVYRQLSNEYDARTTITEKGHRVPGTDRNPDVVFVGDSFTYGWGIEDDAIFPTIYCETLGRACANLGAPGTGTAKQLDRLERYLSQYAWRPAEVKLFFFGMAGSWSAGNDFVDNFDEKGSGTPRAPEPNLSQPPPPEPSLAERLIGLQSAVLGRSNLMRVAKYRWGPVMKSLLVADPGESRMAEALRYTQQMLSRLDAIARSNGFTYTIYLIVPVQDIIRGSYPQTLSALNAVSPKPVVGTAQLFLDNPQQYYFSYDGHLNPSGSRRIADYLVTLDRSEPGRAQAGGR